MAKPVALAIDDLQVLRAVERDLRRKYTREHRVLRAASSESALDALDKLLSSETLSLPGDPADARKPSDTSSPARGSRERSALWFIRRYERPRGRIDSYEG